MQKKSPTTAAILSFLVTGGGQLYNGQIGKGFLLMGSALLLTIFIPYLGIVFAICLWIYSMIDANSTAVKINKAEKSKYPPVIISTNKSVEKPSNSQNYDNWIHHSTDKNNLDSSQYYDNWIPSKNQSSSDQSNDNFIPNKNDSSSSQNNDNWIPHSTDKNNINNSNAIIVKDFIEQLNKFKKLYDNNMLSFTEYESIKKQSINQLDSRNISEKSEDFLLELIPLIKSNVISEDDLEQIKQHTIKKK